MKPRFSAHIQAFANALISVAVGAAIYSSIRKLTSDKTLRLYRNKPEDREH